MRESARADAAGGGVALAPDSPRFPLPGAPPLAPPS